MQILSHDEQSLRLYCVLFDRYARALEKIADEGEIVSYTRLNNRGEDVHCEKPNLWLKVAETCESRMASLLRDLGLTPGTRSNVKPTAAPPAEQKPPDPLDVLLRRPGSSQPSEVDLESIDETLVN